MKKERKKMQKRRIFSLPKKKTLSLSNWPEKARAKWRENTNNAASEKNLSLSLFPETVKTGPSFTLRFYDVANKCNNKEEKEDGVIAAELFCSLNFLPLKMALCV